MVEKKTVVRNKAGIHCRPSSVILSEKEKNPGVRIKVISEKGISELNGILELLALGLQCGDELTIQTEGENEASVCDTFCELFSREFDFPPQS